MVFQWAGDSFVPLDRFKKRCDEQFVVGARYVLTVGEERSDASHGHYFAVLTEKWQDLPEMISERFPTPEHFRRYCLIKTGYRDERSFVCASKAEAVRLAAFMRPIDEFSLISVNENVVIVWTAKSQSYRAQGNAEFQRSKSAVLQYADDLIAGDIK